MTRSGQWLYRVDVRDVWRDDSKPFEERRDVICKRLRNSQWYAMEGDPFGDLDWAVEELQNSQDIHEFDQVWDSIYDLADRDRTWIATSF